MAHWCTSETDSGHTSPEGYFRRQTHFGQTFSETSTLAKNGIAALLVNTNTSVRVFYSYNGHPSVPAGVNAAAYCPCQYVMNTDRYLQLCILMRHAVLPDKCNGYGSR